MLRYQKEENFQWRKKNQFLKSIQKVEIPLQAILMIFFVFIGVKKIDLLQGKETCKTC